MYCVLRTLIYNNMKMTEILQSLVTNCRFYILYMMWLDKIFVEIFVFFSSTPYNFVCLPKLKLRDQNDPHNFKSKATTRYCISSFLLCTYTKLSV